MLFSPLDDILIVVELKMIRLGGKSNVDCTVKFHSAN